MACCLVGFIGFTLVLAAALLRGATAATFVVLDATGWSNPNTGNDGVYRTWATGKEFRVGDTLVFNFPTGTHDVTKVTKVRYDSCSHADPIFTVKTGPANVKLTYQGDHYFICSVGTHCTLGQKLAINVTAPDPTIRGHAASSIPAGCFSVAILSIVIILLH